MHLVNVLAIAVEEVSSFESESTLTRGFFSCVPLMSHKADMDSPLPLTRSHDSGSGVSLPDTCSVLEPPSQ